jgi:23S rRNA (guanosine2251-2'-O)-methyltransferase
MQKLKLEALGRVDVEEFKTQEKYPIVIVMDNVRSALNVGSAFRTADAFSLEKIILLGISATPPHREILKTALGSTESVAWQHYDNTTEAMQQLQAQGYEIVAIEQTDNSILLDKYDINSDKKYALVFGNEVDGVSEAALAFCNAALEIPQYGTKHSLNVSVCVGILGWEMTRQFNLQR